MPEIVFDLSMQFLIPFLFVLAIVFGVLQYVNVFKSKPVNLVISLAIAFFAVSNTTFFNFLWSQLGNITVFFIAMFFIAFIMELTGFRKREKRDYTEAVAIQGAILFILLSISFLIVDYIPELPVIGSGTNLIFLIGIIFVMLIFYAAFKIGGAPPQPQQAKQ